MSRSVAELLDDALNLMEAERAELAELLSASLASSPGPTHPAWAAELRRRVAEIDSGAVSPIAWGDVQAEVRSQLDSDVAIDG